MDCFVHNVIDNVGVVLHDVTNNSILNVLCLENSDDFKLVSCSDIPSNFKISLVDISAGDKVIEYGETIGIATCFIKKGEKVHIHNIESLRL